MDDLMHASERLPDSTTGIGSSHVLRTESILRNKNQRSYRGALSTPNKQKHIAKCRETLPPPCSTTSGMGLQKLVEHILRVTNCKPNKLSTMHVSAAEISKPALQYAALYQRHVSGIDSAVLAVPSTRSIWKRPEDNYENNSREINRSSLALHLQMGNTIGIVEWPPPPKLTSRKLSDYIYKNSSEAFLNIDTPASDKQSSVIDDAGPLNVETDIIYIAPYKAGGEIISEVTNERQEEDTVLLATVGPHDILVNFASDIMDWSWERSRIADPVGTYFGLFRLKSSMWVREKDRRARKIQSVFLPCDIREDLVDDARRFFSEETRDWYAEHNVPYRRAFMFHGPPGTGKTSMIKALASELQRNSCFLSMTNALTPESLADAMANLPKNPMIVIEDFDALFSNPGQMKMNFSALLNILDGIMSEEGLLTIMTTNHVTRIDPIAMRAGRVDRLFFFGPATDDVLRQCFRYFYNGASDATVEKFVVVLQKARDAKARSLATLQEHFIEMREKTAEECVEKLPEFILNYVNRASLLKTLEEKFKEETGTQGNPFKIDGERSNTYAESEARNKRPRMFS